MSDHILIKSAIVAAIVSTAIVVLFELTLQGVM